MDHQLISSLMENNDKTRAQVLELNSEVQRLRKRETELAMKTQHLLQTQILPMLTEQQQATTVEVQSFLEWILMFRMEADAPVKPPIKREEEEEALPTAADARREDYVDTEVENANLSKLVEEVRLLQRLKRREKAGWLDPQSRLAVSASDMEAWEAKHHIKLPQSLRALYLTMGACGLHGEGELPAIYSYSPFLALIPLNLLGWTEVYGQEEELEDEAYLDDDTSNRVLTHYQAGHEFEDEYVCQQLCGDGEDSPSRTRVLLVGAPIDCPGSKNSRMYVNIRPNLDNTGFVGDGLLYRLDGFDNGDSELVKIGTAFDWINHCFLDEVEQRLAKGDPGELIAKRYPVLLANRAKRQREEEEEEEG
ncbi:hypothetical protein BASA81_001076 [Batrachochytrium salamandrivorans]|nr:hypothetical protein BASA81_001076 [Batrachochytrium salamandrivorans]